MTRPSVSRRIAATVLGVDHRIDPIHRPSAVVRQRRLPLGRRLLASILGIRVDTATSALGEAGRTAKDQRIPGASPFAQSVASPGFEGSAEHASLPPGAPNPRPKVRRGEERDGHEGGSARQRSPSQDGPEEGSRWHVLSPQFLLSEDRQDFERILDEALRSAPRRPGLAAVGQRLDVGQLRAMALNASAVITAAAAAEYRHYVQVRGKLPWAAPASPMPASPAVAGVGYAAATAVTGRTGDAKSSVLAVITVVAPILAGTVAVVSALVGLFLLMLGLASSFVRILFTVAWASGAAMAAAILVATMGLVLTALRHTAPVENGPAEELDPEVAEARDAWHAALLERGIVPFLREAVADPGTTEVSRRGPDPTPGRIPHLGFSRPDFASPDFGGPDLAGPDFAGSHEGTPSVDSEYPE